MMSFDPKKYRKFREQPVRVRFLLHRAQGYALWHNKYQEAIETYERYGSQYGLTNDQFYRLGLLYDHLAMAIMFKAKTNTRTASKDQAAEYLSRADALYQDIIKRDRKSFLGWYGKGRVSGVRGNYRSAIRYQKRAYKYMLTQPRHARRALGIGFMFEMLGNVPQAEYWYKREVRNAPTGDYGTTANLFRFYLRRGQYRK
ncbi:MAG TPA: tetratricopeptide repeat protein, partial [Candidatus Paceibacterota bacterium]|nr:tetratricopeptide repeat protein [Candidatus Paceibacterota bacterium]